MRQNAKAPATLLAGFAVGAGIIGALQAQGTKKPSYVIADVDITDLAAYQAYGAKVPPTLKAYNGRIIVRGKPSPKEGAPPQGINLLCSNSTAWRMLRNGTRHRSTAH